MKIFWNLNDFKYLSKNEIHNLDVLNNRIKEIIENKF